MSINLYDLDHSELEESLVSLGEPAYRAKQILQGLYQSLWTDLNEFSNLPLSLRKLLADKFHLAGLVEEKTVSSRDSHTRKTLYKLGDGSAIETVLMEYDRGNTVCISSQVGCALGCKFCATGEMGYSRNLSSGEIIEQVIKSAAHLSNQGKKLTNVVFMGMGEPFQNYSAVRQTIESLNDPNGFGFGKRRFTVSTVGLVPGIRRFMEEDWQVNLAISLHAADDDLRTQIVPINKTYPISVLLEACDEYINQTNRRISIEWALIDGVNDSSEQAGKLVNLVRGKLYHVNLIRLNPVAHYEGKPAADQRAKDFQELVSSAGISCTTRLRRGIDINAGCGQLANQSRES
jgi:23S rRNA (adenine2503-C2)-methyltransferase